MSTTTFGAWVGRDATAGNGNLTFEQVESKAEDADDIDVRVQYCGLCGSDASALLGHFGPIAGARVCGHEIVGEVIRAGSGVKNGIAVGDIVGIGAQADSCRECEWCEGHEEQYCLKMAFTFGGVIPRGNAKGQLTQGGFGKFWRGSSRFAVKIPRGVDPAAAAPLLCGGVTVYSPLKAYGAGTTAKNVGVLGIGGLGHMAIIIANAMGAKVTAISRGEAKRDDALKLGASEYVATGDNLANDLKNHASTLDLIICTINPPSLPINEYVSLLRPRGKIILVGIVPKPLQLGVAPIIMGGKSVGGSAIGSPSELEELLELAADKKFAPWIQKYNFDDINTALVDFNKGLPKYRFVLVNTDMGARL